MFFPVEKATAARSGRRATDEFNRFSKAAIVRQAPQKQFKLTAMEAWFQSQLASVCVSIKVCQTGGSRPGNNDTLDIRIGLAGDAAGGRSGRRLAIRVYMSNVSISDEPSYVDKLDPPGLQGEASINFFQDFTHSDIPPVPSPTYAKGLRKTPIFIGIGISSIYSRSSIVSLLLPPTKNAALTLAETITVHTAHFALCVVVAN
jgi:hypothetical protein